jgi:hypothetical protein
MLPTDLSDGVVSMTVPQRGAGRLGVIFRARDNNNFYLWYTEGTHWVLTSKISGSWSDISSGTLLPSANDRLAVHLDGPKIELRHNDQVLYSTATATSLQADTKHGLYGYAASSTSAWLVDDFRVGP